MCNYSTVYCIRRTCKMLKMVTLAPWVLSCFLGFLLIPFLVAAAGSLSMNRETGLNEILVNNPRLVNLGGVNGKLYLMDNSTLRTWFESQTYAESVNMKLGDISSKAESDFLQNLSQSLLPFVTCYWTAGRDSLQESQFIWSSNQANFSGHGMHFFGGTVIRSCVVLENDESRRALHAFDCAKECFVLLQISI